MSDRIPKHDCEWCDERLEPWLDGDLSADETAAVAAHVRDCERCGRQVALARRITTGLRSAPADPCPGRVVETLARETRPRPSRFHAALAAGFLAGALALGVVWQMNGDSAPGRPSRAEIAEARADLELALGYVAAAGRAAGRDVGNVLAGEAMHPIRSGLKMNVKIPVPRRAQDDTVETQS